MALIALCIYEMKGRVETAFTRKKETVEAMANSIDTKADREKGNPVWKPLHSGTALCDRIPTFEGITDGNYERGKVSNIPYFSNRA